MIRLLAPNLVISAADGREGEHVSDNHIGDGGISDGHISDDHISANHQPLGFPQQTADTRSANPPSARSERP